MDWYARVREALGRTRRRPLPLIDPTERPHDIERVVFICGLHRSGTTLLEQQLRARFDLSVLRAPVPENEGQFLQDVYPIAAEYGGVGRFAFAPEMHPAAPEADKAEAMRTRLLACWQAWREGDAPTLLEKSPPNITKIRWLRGVFPGSSFIILTRDPRAVAAASAKWRNASHTDLIFHWHVAYEAALDALADDCTVLRYEALVDDPDNELTRVGADLSLTPRTDRQMAEERFKTLENRNAAYLEAAPHHRFGSGAWDRLGYDLGERKRSTVSTA